MSDAIGYLRVSTQEQGRSGLGLAAQRADIEAFAAREGLSVQQWYQDIQTGAGKVPLLLRPALACALKDARSRRCPLIVSRLDRLLDLTRFGGHLMFTQEGDQDGEGTQAVHTGIPAANGGIASGGTPI
jgi:hypothetical protein